ncbi:MAG: pyrroline-5-carboxylate reductase [Polyangiales bacterium]
MALGKKIAFLGGGNMATAMIQGLLARDTVAKEELFVTEPVEAQRSSLETRFGIRTGTDNRAAVADADVIVLAVKPQVVTHVLVDIRDSVRPGTLVISIAAGVPIETLQAGLPAGTHVVRTMPNTPALVGHGATGLAPGRTATEENLALAKTLFDSIGLSVVVPEHMLDAVTGLSGSGPAYVFLFIEALADGGVRSGLPRDAALRLAAQTVLGSARMVLETGKHPGELKDMVTSPGGTTIAGVHALENAGFRGATIDAVKAATDRSAELGHLATKK